MPMSLRISILSDATSWLNTLLPNLVEALEQDGHEVVLRSRVDELNGGDICFYLSVGQIIPRTIRSRFSHNLVVHGSRLPQGKGWSPMSWQIVEGAADFTLTLFEAEDRVDSGPIYAQQTLHLNGTELVDEWRAAQADVMFSLCTNFVRGFPGTAMSAKQQEGAESFYPRRTPEHSALDPHKTIAEQFDVLRVVDNERYPAFFVHRGERYILRIERASERSN